MIRPPPIPTLFPHPPLSRSVNHDPAATFLLTGSEVAGRPTLGAWLSYGLGSVERNLPAYVVLMSGAGGQPIPARFWNSGFLDRKSTRLNSSHLVISYAVFCL